jgi:hypothetical protein
MRTLAAWNMLWMPLAFARLLTLPEWIRTSVAVDKRLVLQAKDGHFTLSDSLVDCSATSGTKY